MNIFYFSAEVEPFAKSGGMGDVLGALPKAVAKKKSNHVSVVMPLYCNVIPLKYKQQFEYLGYYYTEVNWRHQYVGVFRFVKDNVTYYFLDNEYYFQGPMYCFADNERFAYFSKASLDLVVWLNQKADILHCNDWSTAYIPLLKKAFFEQCPQLNQAKVVYTIHNLKYQGKMGVEMCRDLTGLPDWCFTDDVLIDSDCVNLMKGAIVVSDIVTTVSDTYTKEIQTSRYGEGLDYVIRNYSYKVKGIINGVDYSVYSPSKDKFIAKRYNRKTVNNGKAINRKELQQKTSLPLNDKVPLIAFVSRMVDQKGLDMVNAIMPRLLQKDVQVVVLGTGDKQYEDACKSFAYSYPNKLSANIYFNNALAHQIYASADFVLLPSVFEPCGLTQLIGLKYGAVPIVRETGGLKDTVLSYNEQTLEGNGFSFAECNADDLLYTICRAIDFYVNHKEVYNIIRQRGMSQDFSWKVSANKYIELYKSLLG